MNRERMRGKPIYRLIFLVVLAPAGSVVLVTTLLLLGVEPRRVFFAGHAVRSLCNALGIDAPNAVGVLSTVSFWWVVIAMLGLAWERRRRAAGV